jgi:hypothetical protein
MQLLGTVVASPIVQGNSDIDSYGTHYSFLGVGGYQEYLTIAQRDGILIDPLNRLGGDGLSSGRRRLGMLAYVSQMNTVYQLNVPYNTWTGLTDAGKVSALANNTNWIPYASAGSGGGDAIKRRYQQNGHGFSVGQVIAYDGTDFVLKSSAYNDTNETLGLVSRIDDVDNFTITYAGFFDATSVTGLSANTVYFVSPITPGAITPIAPTGLGQENRPILIMQTATEGIVVQYRGQIITENELTGGTGTTNIAGVIGPAEDGSYADGLFPDFVPTTPTGTAVDRFNEVLKGLAPTPAPDLTSIQTSTSFASGKLSFGVSKVISGYSNVSTSAGNTAVDINGAYLVAGTRRGIVNTNITGQLNSSVVATTSYPAGAIGEGDQGQLEMYLNGVLVGNLVLSSGSGATSNSRFNVSAVSAVTFTNGSPFKFFKFRTGTFTVPTSIMANGFNYLRIHHVRTSGTVQTNYQEWVYDPNVTTLSVASTSFSGLTLSGSRYISGVRYNTGGTVVYNATISNGYRNVYPNGNAITYPSRTNLSDAGSINKNGTGLTTDISTARTFPALNVGVTNPQLTPLRLSSSHILSNNILGTVGTLGKIETNISITHPLKATLIDGVVSTTGFLQYSTVQANNLKLENFTGEVNRIQDRDYLGLTYANIDSGTYVWDSTQSLVGANAQHNTGLLVFNGELIYPNAAYLNTQYGINAGNFGALTNVLASNPNYSTATGIRVFDRKFKSTNAITQSTLTIEFLHTGTNSSFLTNGATGGTASGNFIKVECLIKRSGGATHGWFNPFAAVNNPEGIANTTIATIAGGTSVTCTLSTVPRIGNGDILIVRVYAASGWTNRISNINVVNI